MKPLVSIVIPVYNTEKYVGKCLDTLINQTYKETEIICVDDGSTDSSREIILDYAKKDARVRLVRQEHSNAGAARNRGLEMAKGEYIAFLDSDDFFQTDMLEKMVEKAVSTHADCVFCRRIDYDNEKILYEDRGLTTFQNACILDWDNFTKDDIPDHIYQLTACVWDKFYKLSFIRTNGLLFQEQWANNDILFVFMSLTLAKRMAIRSDVAVIYRTNNAKSLQGSWSRKWHCIFNAFEELYDWLQEQNVLQQVEKSFVNCASAILISYLERLTEKELYIAFFNYLKRESIKKLGLLSHDESYYYNPDIHKKIKYISEHNCDEYLFYQRDHLVTLNRKYEDTMGDLRKKLRETQAIIKSKHWRFQESRLPKGSGIVIYGYGDVGHDLVEQLVDSSRLRLKAVVDNNFEKFADEPVAAKPVQEIYKMVFDYCIIAVWDKETAKGIQNMLVAGGVCPDKIVWFRIEHEDSN